MKNIILLLAVSLISLLSVGQTFTEVNSSDSPSKPIELAVGDTTYTVFETRTGCIWVSWLNIVMIITLSSRMPRELTTIIMWLETLDTLRLWQLQWIRRVRLSTTSLTSINDQMVVGAFFFIMVLLKCQLWTLISLPAVGDVGVLRSEVPHFSWHSQYLSQINIITLAIK